MSKFKPMELISQLRGKVCSHSDIYFAERNGTQYTGKICNPYTGPATEKQVAARARFSQVINDMKALTPEQMADYQADFNRQKKHKTLRGYIFKQLYNQPNND